MNSYSKISQISRVWLSTVCVVLGLAFAATEAHAQAGNNVAGIIEQVSGTVSVQRGGTTSILAVRSNVLRGDVLVTQRDSYATVKFSDSSSATLRPNSTLRIDDYQFNPAAPQNDSFAVSLLKGGLRTITGLIGKRGNQDAYKIQTSTATIGIRGSTGDTFDCTQGCEGVTPTSGNLPAGVYHVTHTDLYIMVTNQGQILIGAGQFGFSSDINKPPVLLPADPGLGLTAIPFTLGTTNPVQECQVR